MNKKCLLKSAGYEAIDAGLRVSGADFCGAGLSVPTLGFLFIYTCLCDLKLTGHLIRDKITLV